MRIPRAVTAAATLLAIASGSVAAAEVRDAGAGNSSSSAFIAWARSAASEFRGVELDANDSDLRPFCDLVGRAHVVALGEPGHGAHQPLELRNRIFAYLVEHCGFTAIALETSFTESRAVHDYVAGAPVTLATSRAGRSPGALVPMQRTRNSSSGCTITIAMHGAAERYSSTASI